MTQEELKDIARCGETTTIQFKEQFTGQKEIVKEMIAFANTLGGQIFFGIKDKTGELVGLSYDEIQTINRELGNAANEHVRPTIYITTDVVRAEGKHFLVCTVAQGKNKPYKGLNGEIWVKQGADKRRITENSEILATFMVKAVSFFGNELAGTQYRDTKEIVGNMPQIYEKSMSFMKSNLHNIQEKGASFNSLGKLEIAEEVLEEVLQNALVHRDLLRSAPIRIFIFDNRVEIISPGALAGGLTEEDIRNGKTYQRNPYMATFATNALHYRGIGSGIVRILAEYPEIEIVNDVSGKEFKMIIPRTIQKKGLKDSDTTQKRDITTQKELESDKTTIQKGNATIQKSDSTIQKSDSTIQKDLDSSQKKVLQFLKKNPQATIDETVEAIGDLSLGGVKFVISKLQKKGLLKRVGGRKHGEWQVLI